LLDAGINIAIKIIGTIQCALLRPSMFHIHLKLVIDVRYANKANLLHHHHVG